MWIIIKSKGWLTIAEIETIRRKTDSKGRDKEGNGVLEENDKSAEINVESIGTADINIENFGINQADSVNEGPIVIRQESDLTKICRDRLLKKRQLLEDNVLENKEINL